MTLNIDAARAEALFVSPLPVSLEYDRAALNAAIAAAVRRHGGVRGCAADMAAEFGEHPRQAAGRMLWALEVVPPLAARRKAVR